MFKPGDCFRIESGFYEDGTPKFHPFVVLTDFDKETGDAIFVSFSSIANKPRFDTTTIIPAGSHEFITEDSYAAYYLADRMSQEELEKKINNGEATQGKPISTNVLARLRAGIMASKDTPTLIKDFYEDCLYRRL